MRMSARGDLWLRLVQSVATVEAELGRILQDQYGIGLSDYRALEALEKAPKVRLVLVVVVNAVTTISLQ